jgi:molybdopterin-binding protein
VADGVAGSQPLGWNGQVDQDGTVTAEVVVDVAGNDVVAAITPGRQNGSVWPGRPGRRTTKATEVLIGRE